MKIQVTQEDIDNGVRSVSCECPIALAANRATSKYCSVFGNIAVYDEPLQLDEKGDFKVKGNLLAIEELPEWVFEILKKYDIWARPMKPFEFEIDLRL